jgi:uncharacterized protein (TIGR02611 family)
MEVLKRWWKHIPRPIRQPLVFMVGAAVIVAGLAMLVLPGPGWAAIFLGFAILATEFAFAERVRDWLVDQFKKLFESGKKWWQKTVAKRRKGK